MNTYLKPNQKRSTYKLLFALGITVLFSSLAFTQRVSIINEKGTKQVTGNVVTESATAPTTPSPIQGDIWLDTTDSPNTTPKVWDGNSWELMDASETGIWEYNGTNAKLSTLSNNSTARTDTNNMFIGDNGNVGIGTSSPQAVLDVVSTDSGVILPRVANTAAVTTPVNGMLIYDASVNCVKAYENGAWTGCLSAMNESATVVSDCNTNGITGSFISGVALSGTSFSVTLTNNSFATADIAFQNSDVVLSGVSGISVSSTSPASANLMSGQSVLVTYNLSGTPADNGTLKVDWTKLSLSCTVTHEVSNGDATFTLPQTHEILSVYDAGPPVVDMQGVLDNGTNQVVVNVPYTSGVGSYDAYTSTAVSVTGEGGDANNITISYPAGTFSSSGTIPVTVTVDGDGSFDVAKQDFGVTTTFATLDFQVNGNSKGNILLDATGGIPDRAFGDGIHDFIYLPVTSATGKTWLNHNLGAAYADTNHASFDPTQQATSLNDALAYGSLYQWGRYSDGHELRTSATTIINATNSSPGHADFILESAYPNDWLAPQDNTLWQGVSGTNNPCPSGYRIPTETEWDNERLAFVPINSTGAFESVLKLSATGHRFPNNGTFGNVGAHGNYWASTVSGTNTRRLTFATYVGMSNGSRAAGYAVRCIKD